VHADNAIGGARPAVSFRTQRRQTPRHAGGSCLPRGALLQPQPQLMTLGHRHRHPHQHHSRAAAAAVRPPWRLALQHSGRFAQDRGGFVSGPVDLLPPPCQGCFSGCGVVRQAATGAGLWISKATLRHCQTTPMLSDESTRSWEAYRSYCCPCVCCMIMSGRVQDELCMQVVMTDSVWHCSKPNLSAHSRGAWMPQFSAQSILYRSTGQPVYNRCAPAAAGGQVGSIDCE
jgi:hypothetical protein